MMAYRASFGSLAALSGSAALTPRIPLCPMVSVHSLSLSLSLLYSFSFSLRVCLSLLSHVYLSINSLLPHSINRSSP